MEAPPTAFLAVAALAVCAAVSADLPPGATPVGGNWVSGREIQPFIRQSQEGGGEARLVLASSHPRDGAFRVTVQPGLGVTASGMLLGLTGDPAQGLALLLGTFGETGFALLTTAGDVLWSDRYAPWEPYQTYILECVVDGRRARIQMFDADTATLLSQSPWLDLPQDALADTGKPALFTRGGIARFWSSGRWDEPLSPIVPDAPNLRRLASGEDSPWRIVGPGSWMWTSGEKRVIRQYAQIERSSAIHTGIRGAQRSWECRVKVDPGAGGAGMLFQCSDDAQQGFLAWLGGVHGDGGLMLYRLPLQALWGGAQGAWKYDTPYTLRAQAKDGKVQVTLLDGGAETVIQQSPWIAMQEDELHYEGSLGFMTWLGTAEFWGFSQETSGIGPVATSSTGSLGGPWLALGEGKWSWVDDQRTRLSCTSGAPGALVLNTSSQGALGTWRCLVTPGEKAVAGLAFQISRDGKAGFACVVYPGGARMISLDGRVMWEDNALRIEPGKAYLLEGVVDVDRVSAKVLSPDGLQVLSRSPDVYVPDTNNHRTGHVGALCIEGSAAFEGWKHP
ncbi:MAG: hypothetical protein HPY44_02735 [Armatimonadetes bacterium]|nr:hypothetical protein [Armatimonadota bacterium]